MKRWIARIIAGLALAGAILLGDAWLFGGTAESADAGTAPDPTALPPAWQSMTTGEVVITPSAADDAEKTGSSPRRLAVRIADEPDERAQGMQHLPAAVIADQPIWFAFAPPRRVGWHMQNVRGALDIAYINADGVVIDVERMTPGGTGYGIDAPIAAALELAAGAAERHGIRPGTRLTLTD
ncbi:hypothetical protein BA899_05245 [Spiribacter sp. SSL99]|uniref:DUF192 domain-containing protein n=1 Tax=Spiribacter sp. SSL99 TaxID=1866884 RepID=UPI00132FA032|nr:DUF192 domain-containing protein [Spiribacter sp. SSL99]KAF0285964.1 hypothetical protein BA899_05245 [Spiribacter sp. SSL99]